VYLFSVASPIRLGERSIRLLDQKVKSLLDLLWLSGGRLGQERMKFIKPALSILEIEITPPIGVWGDRDLKIFAGSFPRVERIARDTIG
jgi:hypothetical protein